MKPYYLLSAFVGLLFWATAVRAAPAITVIHGVTNGTYGPGAVLDFTVNFSEPILLTGTDSTLGLTLGSTGQNATYLSNATTHITYRYTVQAGDSAPVGIVVGVINLGTSTLTDLGGGDATIDQAGSTDFLRSTFISTGIALPVGLRTDPASGNLFVADVNNSRIRTFSSEGTLLSTLGEGVLNKAYGFAVDGEGNFVVANTFGNTLAEFTSAGVFVRTIGVGGSGPGQFSRPFGVAFDGSSNILVADYNNNRIQVLQRDGTWIRSFGTTGSGQLNRPTGVLVDGSGEIVVSDNGSSLIHVFQSDGSWIRTFGAGHLSGPYGLTRDAANNLLVASYGSARIVVFTRTGLFQRSFVADSVFPASVGGVAVDASGDLFVSNSSDNRVQRWGRLFPVTAFVDGTSPTDIDLSALSIAENLAPGSVVGTLSVTDVDAVDTATFTLVSGVGDTDNASFSIDGTSLSTAEVFDFETRSTFSVRIRVTDAGGVTYEEAFTVTITDVNEPPVFSGYHFMAAKNTSASVLLAKILARTSDPEGSVRSIVAVALTSLEGGTVVLQPSSILYTPAPDFTGADNFSFVFVDGQIPNIGVISVTVGTGVPGNGGALVAIIVLGNEVNLSFAGIPGGTYLVQRSHTLTEPVIWDTLAPVQANASGLVIYTDSSPPSPSYWRTLSAP